MENPLEGLLHLEPLLTLLLAYVSYILTGIYKNQKEFEKKLLEHKEDFQTDKEELEDDISELTLSINILKEWRDLYIRASDSYVTHQLKQFEDLWKKLGDMEKDFRGGISENRNAIDRIRRDHDR